MSPIDIRTGDSEPNKSEKLPIVIILDRLRSAHNVGNIFRLAEICQVKKIICCGYTACPPHPKLEKTAMACDQLVESEHFDDASEAVESLKKEGYKVLAVETVKDAPLYWNVNFELPVALVFGNEALGIQEETLNECDAFIQLPVYGFKNSLNVGNTAAVILYKIMEQIKK